MDKGCYIKLALEVLNAYTENVNVGKSGCFILLKMTENDSKRKHIKFFLILFNLPHVEIEVNQASACKAGAIEVLLSTMNMHIDNETVCEHGSKALSCLIKYNGKQYQTLKYFLNDILEANKTIASNSGAIEVVLNAMDIHIDNYIICKYVSSIISFMIRNNSK